MGREAEINLRRAETDCISYVAERSLILDAGEEVASTKKLLQGCNAGQSARARDTECIQTVQLQAICTVTGR